ncbi:hypothetical protein N2152v2_008922 [Parachlorella kessleri]
MTVNVMNRYLPPHQRKGAINGDAVDAERRNLDFHNQASQVRLVVPSALELKLSECPVDADELEGLPEGCKALTLYYPEKAPEELLVWFKTACGECNARLEFPTELSKLERARWHSLAHRKGLHTESRGVGDDRFLSVLTQPPAAEDGSGSGGEGAGSDGGFAGGSSRVLNRHQRHRAQQVYDFCQLEGGRFWDYSKGELEEMVASGQPWPEDLRDMVERRERGAKVSQLLRQGQPAEALQMLFDSPKLAWQKDEYSGGYPIHIATFKGYNTVVQFLASLPNVIEQRDGQRETPLAIAIRRGNLEMQTLLIEAGADLEHANFHREPPLAPAKKEAGHSSSEEEREKEEEYISWNRAERRAYKHGGEGGPNRRQSLESRRSLDGTGRRSIDAGKGSGRRRSVDFPQTSTHCPW